jgi:hypothetical protein
MLTHKDHTMVTLSARILSAAVAALFLLTAAVTPAVHAAEPHVFRTDPSEHTALLTANATTAQVVSQGFAVLTECSEVAFSSTTVADHATDITGHPIYNNNENTCTSPVLGKLKVSTTGCNYTFTTETNVSNHAGLHIVCEAGKAIKVETVFGCILSFSEQTVDGIHFTTLRTGEETLSRHLRIKATILGTAYSSNVACQLVGIKSSGQVNYAGNITVKGFEDIEGAEGKQIGVYLEGAEEEADSFHSHVENTILTGEPVSGSKQTVALFSKEGEEVPIECEGASLVGTETGKKSGTDYATSTITVHPEYYGSGGPKTTCELAALELAATVSTGTCHYKLAAKTDVNGHGQALIECGEKTIEITLPNCVIKIPTQTPGAGGFHYESNKAETTEKWDVKLKATVEGLKYTTNNGSGCKALGLPTEASNATLTGEITLKGYEDTEKTETGTYKEGSQTGIWEGPAE